MSTRKIPRWTFLLVLFTGSALALQALEPAVTPANYKGWKTLCLSNSMIEVQVLPQIGGRIIQFKLGARQFMWVNPLLAGTFPPSNGLAADGGAFNVGGDKLWPAPQGWDNDQQWPGPPDAVLDGQPYVLEQLSPKPGEAAVRLTSGKDPRCGIQFSRVIRIFKNSTRVSFEASMRNVDIKPRRWGIWAHTQLDGGKGDGSGCNPLMQAWCPLNPQSKFPKGYAVIFGQNNNPSFQADPARGLMHVRYQYQVGKIGLDSPAGWVATVDGDSGAVFVQRFVFEPGHDYPDGSSVEFWLNGLGQFHAYNRDIALTNAAETPCVFESEVLSPFARLEPGQSYTWRYDWYASNIGGDFPVVDCTDAGVVAERLSAARSPGQVKLTGRFGVFAPGALRAEFVDAHDRRLKTTDLPLAASPLKALVLDILLPAPPNAASVRLVFLDANGKAAGELAKTALPKREDASH